MKKKLSGLTTPFLFAMFMVPIDDQSQWQVLEYSSAPPNKIEFTKEGMQIKVESSSSPIIYQFHKPVMIKKIVLKAKLSKGVPPRIPASVTQGDEGYDDFPLRLGIVKMGTKRLNWLQRQLAPKWLVTLHRLAPEGVGIDYIKFLSASSNAKDVGMKREHPLSSVLMEEVVTSVQPDGSIHIEQNFKKPMTSLALWLGLDGDDTKSHFNVNVTEITITEAM